MTSLEKFMTIFHVIISGILIIFKYESLGLFMLVLAILWRIEVK